MQSLCTSLQGGESANSKQVEELMLLNKQLTKENQAAALEVKSLIQLRKEVERLRGIQDEADRHCARSEKLQQVGTILCRAPRAGARGRSGSILRIRYPRADAAACASARGAERHVDTLTPDSAARRAQMLAAADAARAELEQARAAAEDWRLAAALALPDAATPADAARECAGLRRRVVVLEGEVAPLLAPGGLRPSHSC
jgi:hypothetical protein